MVGTPADPSTMALPAADGPPPVVRAGLVRPRHGGGDTLHADGRTPAALTRLMDALQERMLLCDGQGRPLHENTPLRELLAREPGRAALERGMRAAARRALAVAPADRTGGEAAVRIVTARGWYEVRASDLGGPLPGGARVAVTLWPSFREPIEDAELRRGFRLTPREVVTARLIAAGLHNDDIARRLRISPHTVRRHTEHVLRKLGVASRVEVQRRITRD